MEMANIHFKKWKNKKKKVKKKQKLEWLRKHETSAKTHDCCVNALVHGKESEV